MKNLLGALIKARAEFKPIEKDGFNPHFRKKYATLDSILDAVTPSLCSNNLAVTQTISIEAEVPRLITTLWHVSGESLATEYPLRQSEDPQKFAGALTYARRYSISALLSITADQDDDGTTASKPSKSSENAALNTKIIGDVAELIGMEPPQIRTIVRSAGKERAAELTPEERDRVIKQMLVSWSMGQGVFQAPQHAEASYLKMLKENPGMIIGEECAIAWIAKVNAKKEGAAVA